MNTKKEIIKITYKAVMVLAIVALSNKEIRLIR